MFDFVEHFVAFGSLVASLMSYFSLLSSGPRTLLDYVEEINSGINLRTRRNNL